jgi:multidrug efflux pump subunit AcrA (membrane-fusion protein)
MGRGVFWSALGAIVLVAAGCGILVHYVHSTAISSPHAPTGAAQSQGVPGIAVEAAPVSISTVIEDLRAVGTLRPNESVVISPEISGRPN